MLGLVDAIKPKPKTATQRLGSIMGLQSTFSGCINFLNVICAIADVKKMEAAGCAPVVMQLYKLYVKRYMTQNKKRWLTVSEGETPIVIPSLRVSARAHMSV